MSFLSSLANVPHADPVKVADTSHVITGVNAYVDHVYGAGSAAAMPPWLTTLISVLAKIGTSLPGILAIILPLFGVPLVPAPGPPPIQPSVLHEPQP